MNQGNGKDQNDRRSQQSTRHPGVHLIVNLSLPFIVQDFPLPWKAWVLAQLTETEMMKVSRERLSYRIRTSDYRLRYGPVWLKRFAQSVIEQWLRYGFWVLVVFKIGLSTALVSLPIMLFGIYRFYLPDPAPYLEAHRRQPPAKFENDLEPGVANLFPYLAAEAEQVPSQNQEDLQLEFNASEAVALLPLQVAGSLQPRMLEGGSSMALVRVASASSQSAPYAARPAYLLDELRPLVFQKRESLPNKVSQVDFSAEVLGGNSVGGHFLIYSRQKRRVRCRFELRDENQNLLFSVEKFAMAAARSGIQGSFAWRPDITLSAASKLWQSYSFRIDELPRKLSFSVREAVGEDDRTSVGGSGNVQSFAIENKDRANRSDCAVAVSDPYFQKQTLVARQVRGIVLVVVDGLSGHRWDKGNVMPNLQALAKLGQSFDRYFSSSTDLAVATRSILNKETDSGSESVFETARSLGYSTAFFGDTSDLYFDPKDPPNRQALPDFLIGNASDNYGGLAAAIEASDWLETHSSYPFFVVVRLKDLKGRLIPPWKFLDARRFLAGTFGYEGRLARYDAMLSYMDENISIVAQTLRAAVARHGSKALLVVTGSAGIQAAEFGHRDRSSLGGIIRGASFAVGADLLPDALHVPLVNVALEDAAEINSGVESSRQLSQSARGFATHHELHDYLEKVLQEDRLSQISQRRSPLVITEPQGLALLGPSDDSLVSFWGKGLLQASGRLFRRQFPFQVLNEFEATGAGVSLTYNPKTGSLFQKPRSALSARDFDVRDFLAYAFLQREPSLLLSSTAGGGVRRLRLDPVARASGMYSQRSHELQPVLAIAQIVNGRPQTLSTEFAYSNEGGSVVVEASPKAVTQGRGPRSETALVASDFFGGASSLTLEAVNLSVCGARFESVPFTLSRSEILELRRAPPLCMLMPRLDDFAQLEKAAATTTTLGYGWP